MKQQDQPNKRNVINQDEIAAWITRLLENKGIGPNTDVENWCTTVLANYVLHKYKTQLVLPIAMKHFCEWMLNAAGRHTKKSSEIHFVNVVSEPWLQEAFDRGDRVCRVVLDTELHNIVDHVIDYIQSRKWTDVTRASFPDMVNGAHAWVQQLVKQKTIESDTKHVKVLVEAQVGGKTFTLVELLTREAYSLEGKRMHNCIASYFSSLPKSVQAARDALSVELADEQKDIEALEHRLTSVSKVIDQLNRGGRAVAADEGVEEDELDEDDEDDEDEHLPDDEEDDDDEPARPRTKSRLKWRIDPYLKNQFRGIWSVRDENNEPIMSIEIQRVFIPTDALSLMDLVTKTLSPSFFLWYAPQIRTKCNGSPTEDQLKIVDQLWASLNVKRTDRQSASSLLTWAKTKFLAGLPYENPDAAFNTVISSAPTKLPASINDEDQDDEGEW